MRYISVAWTKRQNVRKAFKLFSLTAEKPICHNFPEYSHTRQILIILNNTSDTLNSQIQSNTIKWCVYGAYNMKNVQEQNDALNNMESRYNQGIIKNILL